jgi:hypothetical protein
MTQMQHPEPVARRLFELTEPIALVNFFSQEPNDSMAALGFCNYWDGYFAGRSAPLGRVPADEPVCAWISALCSPRRRRPRTRS